MKLTYDPRHHVAYLRLHERPTHVETIRISDALHVDLAPDGTSYGIELLNADEQLCREDHGTLIVINESTGKTMEENLQNVQPYPEGQEIILPLSKPIKSTSVCLVSKKAIKSRG